ncbi:hypothetical protein [Acuticoccus sp. I52.16.1]|uniref:hypothetical protein n=1 Tax=Acuticoccus sp. I52.16.1 TaxID=2928472 RepID=UPI001FD5D8D6|nr:hypothetical protein [Acuticoccus sp. I52.16.1]UOM34296.1 hypothetical protein MRB58_21120 [Acuticoccus sp. I52.16.1]
MTRIDDCTWSPADDGLDEPCPERDTVGRHVGAGALRAMRSALGRWAGAVGEPHSATPAARDGFDAVVCDRSERSYRF